MRPFRGWIVPIVIGEIDHARRNSEARGLRYGKRVLSRSPDCGQQQAYKGCTERSKARPLSSQAISVHWLGSRHPYLLVDGVGCFRKTLWISHIDSLRVIFDGVLAWQRCRNVK